MEACEHRQTFVFLLELFNNPVMEDGRIFAVKKLFTVFDGISLDEKENPSK
jgi:hypothetical protein